MRKRFRILLVLLLVAVVGGIAWLMCQPQEPQYQGKSLSYWLAYPGGMTAAGGKMEQAVRSIGTNGIPIYLNWLKAKDSPLRDRVIYRLRNQSLVHFSWSTAGERRIMGYSGLDLLGPTAAPAVPALVRMLTDTNNPETLVVVMQTLGTMGPTAQEAVPALIQCLDNTTGYPAEQAASALARIHTRLDLTVPALAHHLKVSTNQPGQLYQTLNSLEQLGPEARTAVPAIMQCLRSPFQGVRSAATNAIRRIDPPAATLMGIK